MLSWYVKNICEYLYEEVFKEIVANIIEIIRKEKEFDI